MRTEIGVAHEIGRQALPVVVNECIVRGFYFARRLFTEIKESNVKSVFDLKNINWKNTLPFKNRTVVRMLTISTSTFMAFDIADAAIRSGGVNATCILRINFVGVGRFAVAIGTDVEMGIKKHKKQGDYMRLTNEQIKLMNAKVYYKEADMWIEAESAGKSLEEAYNMIVPSIQHSVESWSNIHENLNNISQSMEKKREEDALLDAFMEMYFEK